jgi:antirestriction protein ArdC
MPQRPDIRHGQQGAWYKPSTDLVGIPDRERFGKVEAYYSTLYHELAHSTGHKSRLAREEVMGGSFFGSEDYSREELVAEFAAAFLCNHAGIDSTREQSAAYLGSWLKALKNDVRMAVWAAGRAQKAADFILGVAGDDGESPTEREEASFPELVMA